MVVTFHISIEIKFFTLFRPDFFYRLITLYNVCAVPWVCSVPWGDIMSTVGDILSTVGVFSTMGGYHDKCGGYLEYRRGCSVPWGISWVLWGLSWVPWGMFSTMGDIMMHVGISWVPWGCSVPWGIPSFEIWVPGRISWYMWGDIMSTMGVFSTAGYPNNKRLFSPQYWTPSTVLMISPRAPWYPPRYSRYPHGTHDIPMVLMISPWFWTPPQYSRYPPHLSWYPPRYWTPHGTQDIPHGTHGTPMVLNTPTVLSTPNGTAHTLYRVLILFRLGAFPSVSPLFVVQLPPNLAWQFSETKSF